MAEGYGLNASEVDARERALLARPQDSRLRMTLISYYFLNAIPVPRVGHILWLIQNQPESEFHRTYPMVLDARPSLMNTPSDYENGRQLWLSQVASHPGNGQVLWNAAAYMEPGYPAEAARLLSTALQTSPQETAIRGRLILLYVRAISSLYLPDPQVAILRNFGEQTRTMLESSRDRDLVRDTARQLIASPRPSSPAEAAEGMARIREFGRQLLARAGAQ